MPKNIWLILAWIWTVVIAVLCLVSFNKLPGVKIVGADKFVHATLHFIFVFFWSRHFRSLTRFREWRSLGVAVILSILYGCAIELAQEYITTTRQADFKDVIANFAGAALAIVVQVLLGQIKKRKPE